MAGGEAHSHVGKQKLINGTQLSYIISPPCVNTLLAVRAGLLKRNFEYETKSAIQMERGGSNGKACLLLMERWFAIQNTNWI